MLNYILNIKTPGTMENHNMW